MNSLPEDQWLKYVVDHTNGNIFHTPYMYSVYQKTKNYQPYLFVAISPCDGKIIALLLSTQIKIFRGILSRLTSRHVLFGGLLYSEENIQLDSIVQLMNAYDPKICHDTLLTEIRNMNDTILLHDRLKEIGYSFRDYLNYTIDLRRTPEQMYQSFSQSCRRNIRKAENSEIKIKEIYDSCELPIFYQLINKTYSRAKVSVSDASLFENIFRVFYPRNMVKFYIAYLRNEPIACRSVFLFKEQIYDWYAGSDPKYYKYYPNELMVWHILKEGVQMNYHLYDFGGAGYPDEHYGVRDFKSRFGGALVKYGRYTKVHSPFCFQISKWGYRVYQQFI